MSCTLLLSFWRRTQGCESSSISLADENVPGDMNGSQIGKGRRWCALWEIGLVDLV